MPLMVEDLKNNKLYNKQLFLPINTDNKRKGSLIYLLSPSIEESVRLMAQEANSYFKNPNLFYSYYMEKDINLIIHEGCILQNEDREVVKEDMSLYKYYRFTTTSPEEWKIASGKDMEYGQTAIAFRDSNDSIIGYVIISGATLLDAWSISKQIDKELVVFAVDVLQCRSGHTKLDEKYKSIMRNKYDTKTIDKAVYVVGSTQESSVITEGIGNTVLKAEIAIWKAQAKITEDIIKNYDNGNWMKTQYKSMKAKLNKIPIVGYDAKIDDSIDTLRDELISQKATIDFMMSMAELELRDEIDLKDISDRYISWIKATRCSKRLKLKLIKEVKDSYKDTINLYKQNIDKYEKQNAAQKRLENATAIISKTFSIFSFLSSGPLSCLKGIVWKAILPKSKKVNILSVEEMRTKIELYEAIVEQLEEMERDIELNESVDIFDEPYVTDEGQVVYEGINDSALIKDTLLLMGSPLAYISTKLPKIKETIKQIDIEMHNYKTIQKYIDNKHDTQALGRQLLDSGYLDPYVNLNDHPYKTIIDHFGKGLCASTAEQYKKDPSEYKCQRTRVNIYSLRYPVIYVIDSSGNTHRLFLITQKHHTKNQLTFIQLAVNSSTTDLQVYTLTYKGKKDTTKETALREDYIVDPIDVIKSYGFTDDDNIYNTCVITNKSEKPLRARAEVLVFKGDTVFIDYIDKYGNMRLPGGTLEENDSYENAAKREAQEEARITAKNFKRYNHRVFMYDKPKEWMIKKERPENWWYGDYSVTYIAEYDKKYTGYIAPLDKDTMEKTGRFYKISAIYSKCNDYFKGAIDMYLKDHPQVMKESIVDEQVVLKPLWDKDDTRITSTYGQTYDSITYYESTFNEDTIYDDKLKKILYSERLRNQKDVMMYYAAIKNACPEITKTYTDINRYTGLNLFVGCEYYVERFLARNKMKLDKSIDFMYDFINRLINDTRFKEAGYKKTTVFIPVNGWGAEKNSNFWDYTEFTNPMSIIYRLMMRGDRHRLEAWKGTTFLFIGRNGYFKLDAGSLEKKELPKFKANIQKLLDNTYIDCSDEADNSTAAIVANVIAKIEDPSNIGNDTNNQFTTHITINALTGASKDLTPAQIKEKEAKAASTSDDEEGGLDPKQEEIRKKKTKELLDKVEATAAHSTDAEDAMDKLMQDEEFKKIVDDLKMASPNTVDYTPTRVARMNNIKADFAKVTYKDKTLGDLVLSDKYDDKPLKETSIPVDSTNEEWQHLVGTNLADSYDVNDDVYRVIYHFGDCKVPVGARDIKVENTSTSEDTVDTWTVACEDINGKRFTLKFDVPKIINKRFMRLRGNDKVMGNQLMNLPIIKTGLNTTQITSNYNKIFLSPYGSSTGKSFVTADRLMKALGKYTGKNIKFVTGDNSRICNRYDLPLDYIDIASNYTSITFKNGNTTYYFEFNQDTLNEKYKKKIDPDRLCIGWQVANGKEDIVYAPDNLTVSAYIAFLLCIDNEFKAVYDATSVSTKYTYSMASIMSSQIPVAVLIGYAIGLTPMLDRAKVNYKVLDKKARYDKSTHDVIKFSDAIIEYELDYSSSMLLNGLKACDTSAYSIKEANSTPMWLDFLDQFGGRIKSDGLDMFYDLMFDPMTKIACRKYRLPDNYIDGLLYANVLLSDNKYNKHTDITGNRYRNNEIVAAYVYKALCNSYTMYRRSLKIGREATMSIKQSAVIDLILADNTETDYSFLSPLLEFESANNTSFQGLSGMNAKRAYSLDKRIYDASMLNVLSMSTGFAGTVGITRQTTIDPNITSARGYINSNPDKMSITRTFCMTEALTPYGVTCDDPFRTAMTFIQTNKHGMRTAVGDPLLVTTGADEALVYLTSDTFSHKAKGKGKVKEVTKDYMVIEYDKSIGYDSDNKPIKHEVIDLREHAMKNSDGGFYQMVKLDPNYKEGNIVRENDIIAIDNLAYSNSVGPRDNYAYDVGTLVKFCVLETDEGFEDSCRSTEWLAKALSSEVTIEHQYNFNKDTNIYHIVKPGDTIQEGDPVIVFQNAFDDEDANALIRALKTEDEDVVEELGRITLKSKVTGVVKEVQIRRCVEIDECSPTMKKVIKDYESRISGINKAYAKYDKDKLKTAEPNYKLEPTGRLKNSADSVLISIYISYQDDFGISDKVVCYSALKGVSSKEIIPAGKEARSAFRPDERIHYIQSQNGDMKRMVGSIFKMGALNKVLIELHRAMCDDMGIKWYYLDEHPDNKI